jgi:hypothetical protein
MINHSESDLHLLEISQCPIYWANRTALLHPSNLFNLWYNNCVAMSEDILL